MERIQAFYPAGTENIIHHSRNGLPYRLDAIDQPIRIRSKLTEDPRFQVVDIHQTDDSILALTHSQKLVDSYKTGEPIEIAQSSGIEWQTDFYSWVVNKAWATIEASKCAITNGKAIAITSGGHHAEFEHGRGFGPISNMVIAAKKILDEKLVGRIAILDLDVHYANGTHSQVKNEKRILSCDLWRYRLSKWIYTSNSSNIFHKKVENINEYSAGLKSMFGRISTFNPEMLFVYNGLDPLANDRMGGVKGFDEEYLFKRNKLVSDFIKQNSLPAVVFIGGGYIDYSQNPSAIEISKNKLTELFIESSAVALGL